MSKINPKYLAQELRAAQLDRKELSKITQRHNGFSLQDGYRVQRELLQVHKKSGAHLVGRKMGMTSKAKMDQMNLKAPIHGFLTNHMQVLDGHDLSIDGCIHQKVEPEIAFVTNRELHHSMTESEIWKGVEGTTIALEVIDSRFINYEFELPDVVADNCSASHFVVGQNLRRGNPLAFENLGILLEVNGKPAQFGSSAAILGNPVQSFFALLQLLEKESLPAGSIVLAGGATAAVSFKKGDWVRASASGLGSAEFFAV